MTNLITIHTDENGQAVSARELHDKLGMQKDFTDWFKYQSAKIGLIEGIDFTPILGESTGGRPSTDYIIPLDTAKHFAMMSGGDNAHSIRQYFIAVEKQWNSPDAVMARALKMADNKILSLQSSVELLQTENKLLACQTLEWTSCKVLEAIVKAYGASIHIPEVNGFQEAWKDFKKELLYNYGININLRISKAMESSGRKTKPKTMSMIHDDELSKCISTAVALCKSHNVDISDIIGKYKN